MKAEGPVVPLLVPRQMCECYWCPICRRRDAKTVPQAGLVDATHVLLPAGADGDNWVQGTIVVNTIAGDPAGAKGQLIWGTPFNHLRSHFSPRAPFFRSIPAMGNCEIAVGTSKKHGCPLTYSVVSAQDCWIFSGGKKKQEKTTTGKAKTMVLIWPTIKHQLTD